jgi:DICT domain-containing protein/signal transduction histidine kinase
MNNKKSIVQALLDIFPDRRLQMYFKSSLKALCRAMEDQALADLKSPLVIASFQKERFYRQEIQRYQRIADRTDHLYILAAPEQSFTNASDLYETIAFDQDDQLVQEWHLVVIGKEYGSCLICREKHPQKEELGIMMDNARRFDGICTFEREVAQQAAKLLFERILNYRPELKSKIALATESYLTTNKKRGRPSSKNNSIISGISNPDPFVQRLITYLQASQYKLIKANRSLMVKEEKERLINSVAIAIRRSLDPDEILHLAVEKLGQGLGVCRCIIYRYQEGDDYAIINHEYLTREVVSIAGKKWQLKGNPFFETVAREKESFFVNNACENINLFTLSSEVNDENNENILADLIQDCSIISWLLVPVLYQGKLLGMVELHHCQNPPIVWKSEDVSLVDAIATQVGVALIQAEAYHNLETLNQQLEALDLTRSNLVAITGHELRTPLSTIQVCLESLASEPDMPSEMRDIMLKTALEDAERMRKLVQDFLTLSQLESGRIKWNFEALSLRECVELSVSNVQARHYQNTLPHIITNISDKLPLIRGDGEWLVEVLAKLLDNCCKFTDTNGEITVKAVVNESNNMEVIVADTGRGIEKNRLETVFDRFYQEEGALRRSAGGTGLGLAICRQIIEGWGGKIWAESTGKNQGSQFHFTVPIFEVNLVVNK